MRGLYCTWLSSLCFCILNIGVKYIYHSFIIFLNVLSPDFCLKLYIHYFILFNFTVLYISFEC
jgi:hypothetical protein